jgi:ArsR family transcriptional regulator, arsenate/arsenite/antimonite-responsive transcriptional repressor
MARAERQKAAASRTEASWEESARLLKVIAHPIRLLIIEALAAKSQCVKDLNVLVPLDQPQLSQHMAALRKAGIVASHTDGSLRCYYILKPSLIAELIPLLARDHPVVRRDRDTVRREVRGES